MRRIQFTVGGLMGLVIFVGVAIAALRYASVLWASVLLTLDLILFGVAVLGVAFQRGRKRAFSAGMALFGLGYLLLCFGPFCESEIKPVLATTKLLDRLYPHVNPAKSDQISIYGNAVLSVSSGQNSAQPSLAVSSTSGGPASTLLRNWTLLTIAPNEPFQKVGHSLFALLLAFFGGLIARRMADASEAEAGPTQVERNPPRCEQS